MSRDGAYRDDMKGSNKHWQGARYSQAASYKAEAWAIYAARPNTFLNIRLQSTEHKRIRHPFILLGVDRSEFMTVLGKMGITFPFVIKRHWRCVFTPLKSKMSSVIEISSRAPLTPFPSPRAAGRGGAPAINIGGLSAAATVVGGRSSTRDAVRRQ
jgi:hypothetical protein